MSPGREQKGTLAVLAPATPEQLFQAHESLSAPAGTAVTSTTSATMTILRGVFIVRRSPADRLCGAGRHILHSVVGHVASPWSELTTKLEKGRLPVSGRDRGWNLEGAEPQ